MCTLTIIRASLMFNDVWLELIKHLCSSSWITKGLHNVFYFLKKKFFLSVAAPDRSRVYLASRPKSGWDRLSPQRSADWGWGVWPSSAWVIFPCLQKQSCMLWRKSKTKATTDLWLIYVLLDMYVKINVLVPVHRKHYSRSGGQTGARLK